jgi:hypothetical protein
MALSVIFPKVFPGFSPLETPSLAAYGQLFNHSNKFKEAKNSDNVFFFKTAVPSSCNKAI